MIDDVFFFVSLLQGCQAGVVGSKKTVSNAISKKYVESFSCLVSEFEPLAKMRRYDEFS